MQRELNYAIVDEVDSILIDEARTPLIISGQVAHDSNKFVEFRSPVRGLVSKQQTLLNELFRKLKDYDEDKKYLCKVVMDVDVVAALVLQTSNIASSSFKKNDGTLPYSFFQIRNFLIIL